MAANKGVIVARNVIKIEPGYIYVLDKEGNVVRYPMIHNKTSVKR